MSLSIAGSIAARAAGVEGERAPDDWLYQVTPRDTLISIAEDFLIRPADWPSLQKLNRIAQPRQLKPGSTLRIPIEWVRRTATVAEVLFVQGSATLTAGGAAPASPRALVAGDQVRAADLIRTEAGASVSLRFADGSRVLIAPGSAVTVVHLLALGKPAIPSVQLRIEQGDAEIQVAPAAGSRRFEIGTPALNLGVRGTDFRAHFDPSNSAARVEVIEGRVAGNTPPQAIPGKVLVAAGLGLRADVNKPLGKPRPLLPAPSLGAVPARVERVPLRFQWEGTAPAQAYRAQVFARANPGALLLDGIFPGPDAQWVTPGADLPDGDYLLSVRAIDALGLEGLSATAQFALKARPLAPAPVSPAPDAKVYGETASLRWAPVAAAVRYRLQIAVAGDFAHPLFDRADLVEPGQTVSLAPGRYDWRVASISATADGKDDQGPFGDVQTFTQRALPSSPDVDSPQTDPKGLLLRWRAPEAGLRVRVQVAREPGFAAPLMDVTTTEGRALLADPWPGTYYVRFRTIDADGVEGEFGPPQKLEVPLSRYWLLFPAGILLLLL